MPNQLFDIESVAISSGLPIDEIRMMFMETRSDWATFTELTAAERDLVMKSVNSSRDGTIDIAPVNPDEIPLEQQQAIVQCASQVLGVNLTLSVVEEIQLHDAIDIIKNQVIRSNHAVRRRELTQQLNQDWQDMKADYIGILHHLSGQLHNDVEVGTTGIDAKAEIDRLLTDLGKKVIV